VTCDDRCWLVCDRFHPRLVLSAKERTVLAASLVPHAVQSCVHLIDNATSHQPVAKAVHRLALYVIACRHTDVAQLMHSLGFKLTSEKYDLYLDLRFAN
jgi:hypothetical protein